jgi:hypothetical protein
MRISAGVMSSAPLLSAIGRTLSRRAVICSSIFACDQENGSPTFE